MFLALTLKAFPLRGSRPGLVDLVTSQLHIPLSGDYLDPVGSISDSFFIQYLIDNAQKKGSIQFSPPREIRQICAQ